MNGVSVIVPVYNEKESVKKTLAGLDSILGAAAFPYEVIAVDDGSRDGTGEILASEKWSAHIRVLRHSKNKGYGSALKTGIKKCQYDVVFIADCDGTYPLEMIPGMVKRLLAGETDMVVGARTGKDAAIPLVRRPAKWFINVLARYLTGERIPDINSGFRGIRKDALIRFLRILPDGFSFTTTITIALFTNDYSVEYVTIPYYKRTGRSKIRPIYDTVNFIKLVIRTVLYFHPFKIFMPFSAALLLAGAGVGGFTYFFCPHPAANITAMLIIAGVQVFALGLIADMFDKRMR